MNPYMNFSEALECIKKGDFVARASWKKGMFVFLKNPIDAYYFRGHYLFLKPHILLKTADDEVVPWVVSQIDLLAEDWVIVFNKNK